MGERSLLAELRSRKVVQAAAIYVAVAWGVTEIVVTIVEQLFLPQWVATLAVIFFVVGFPVTMFLSWTFDVTADGITRTDMSSRRGTASIGLSIVLLLAGTAGLFFLIKPSLDDRSAPDGMTAISPNSVAVLPFDYAGPNPDDSYLGSGLSDELRDQLGRVEGLRIAARSSSIAVVEDGTDAKAMALKLGVAHLLEGNMRRRGNILRVSVQLVDGASGLTVWNETFDRGRAELLNVQQDIARAVANALLPDSSPEISAPITNDATANEKILLARHYEQQVRERETVDPELLERAIQLYREAIELDPNSALAHSRLAGALIYYGDIDSAEAPAFKALSLNPNLAEVQNTLGNFLFARGSPNMGEPYARAVELNPNLPDALHDYAHWHWFNKDNDGVAELYERALVLDPLNPARYAALGSFLAINDRADEARALAEEMPTTLPQDATTYRAIAKIYDLIGEVDHAIAWGIKARDLEPGNLQHLQQLAEYYTDIGDFQTAFALDPDIGIGLLWKMRKYDDTIDKAELQMIDYPEDLQLRVYLGFAYAAKQRFDDAIRIISTSGLLDNYSHTRRNTAESDGFLALLNAAYGSGETEEARALAEFEVNTHYHSDTADFWVALNFACKQAIIGNDVEVRRQFRMALGSNHLAWEPILKDLYCFRRFASDPAYQAVVRHFDGRRALLRARLPATLEAYGVSL